MSDASAGREGRGGSSTGKCQILRRKGPPWFANMFVMFCENSETLTFESLRFRFRFSDVRISEFVEIMTEMAPNQAGTLTLCAKTLNVQGSPLVCYVFVSVVEF